MKGLRMKFERDSNAKGIAAIVRRDIGLLYMQMGMSIEGGQ